MSPEGSVDDVVAALRGWLDGPDDVRLVVETSGSTGVPKRVLLSRAAVLASVAATERRLGAAGRWALVLPPSYVAGVQVICRSLVAGHEPVTEWPAEGTWFTSLVPTQLMRLLDNGKISIKTLTGWQEVEAGFILYTDHVTKKRTAR